MLLDLADLASETSDEIYPYLPQIAPWWIPSGSHPAWAFFNWIVLRWLSLRCLGGAMARPAPRKPRGKMTSTQPDSTVLCPTLPNAETLDLCRIL
jgi:hypothetical protein